MGKLVMNTNAAKNININPTESGVTVTLEHTMNSVTLTLDVIEWVKEVHHHYSVICQSDKLMEHWRKMELDAALVCGENLVKIRQQYGKQGHGFKAFVAAEFVNKFSYETALRYVKLFNGRSELTPKINSLRKAYIHLGILKQDYAYPKPSLEVDESTQPNQTAPSNNNDETRTGSSKNPEPLVSPRRDPQDVLDKLLDSAQGFVIKMPAPTSAESGKQYFIEFMVNHNGDMLGRIPGKGNYFNHLSPEKYSMLCERIKPIVDWYMSNDPNRVKSIDNTLGGVEYFSIAE